MRRGPHAQAPAVGIERRRRCARLHVAADHPSESERLPDDDRIPRHLGVDVSRITLDTARDVRAKVVVEHRPARPRGGVHVAHPLQRHEVDVDVVGRVYSPSGVVGDHDGDRLADIAHLVARQDRTRTAFDAGRNWVR